MGTGRRSLRKFAVRLPPSMGQKEDAQTALRDHLGASCCATPGRLTLTEVV
jgi:hypothetical protein